jgi:hypothetical protein
MGTRTMSKEAAPYLDHKEIETSAWRDKAATSIARRKIA